jgi:hypothetical protein
MATRDRDLRPDAQGRYRPYLGWKLGPDGVRRQQRFNLGTDRKEAERRLAKLRELYEDNCRAGGDDFWTNLGLSFAEKIAQGESRISFPPPPPIACIEDPITDYARTLQIERDRWPSLDLVPSHPNVHAASVEISEEYVEERIRDLERELRELGALDSKRSLPKRLIVGSFHEALDAYGETIRTLNVFPGRTDLKPYGRLRLERIKRFKQAHIDAPLYGLTFDACTAMVTYWTTRPVGKRGPTSRDNARHHVGELMWFFRWLDRTDQFQWQMPRGLEHVARKIPKTDSERKLSVITKSVYTVGELAILNKHATPLERLMLYLGLNCAMGAAEMGRLAAEEILLGHRHEHAERLHFDSTEADSFIRFLRPKTDVFGEWFLWPETVEMIRWGLERARRIGSELLFISEKGQPWYNEAASNAQYKFANSWTRLLDRVAKSPSHSEFRKLPFGTLRDTLPDLMRHRFGDDLASLCLAHGSPFHGDVLLECYGNKPFGRLHKALAELRSHFSPVFDSAPTEPTEEKKQYLPLETREKVRSLIAQGVAAPQIARECGVSPMTVYREMGRYDY